MVFFKESDMTERLTQLSREGNILKVIPSLEAPVLWPPDGKSWLIGKDPEAGKDWGQEETGTAEEEMVR